MAIGLPVKANYAAGDILTATNMNDLSGTFNNVATSYGNDAGKNKIINGNFGIWQRGTTFSNPSDGTYTADRWVVEHDGTGATRTISQQTFTPGTAPVTGYEGQFFLRYAVSAVGTGNTFQDINQRIEDVRTFAGQTVTFSFWAKAAATSTVNILARQAGLGTGSTQVTIGTASVTTSWQRFSYTVTLDSLAGKTISAGSYLQMRFRPAAATTITLDIWGIQLEAGSITTPFATASGGSIQSELAMCQRYYWRYTQTAAYQPFGTGFNYNTTQSNQVVTLPVTMRTNPSLGFSAANQFAVQHNTNVTTLTSISADRVAPDKVSVSAVVSSGLTSGQAAILSGQTGTTAYIEASAEL